MLEPWQFIIVALCAYRLTRFFVFDSMLGANLESHSKFSQWLDVFAYNADGTDKSWVRGKFADLLVCPYCLGFWLSLGGWAAWTWGPSWVPYVVTAWAVAGAQSMLNITERKLSR